MTTWDKSKMPSRHVSIGPERAPHRSYYYAMGMTAEEIAAPLVGVATCWNEAAPCNIALSRQAQSAKKGVREAGASPREFTTIKRATNSVWHTHSYDCISHGASAAAASG